MSLESSPAPSSSKERDSIDSLKGLPRIPLDLTQHKLSIFINWTIILLANGILPLTLYYSLKYGTTLSLELNLTTFLPLMGVISLVALGRRTFALLRPASDCRPLGQASRWGLDFFDWNFLAGFVILTIVISIGESQDSMIIVSLPLAILMVDVCLQLLAVQLLMAFDVPAFIRFSSIARGAPLRPGVYVVAEDIVAVDGGAGRAFRQAWTDRYDASPLFRAHLRRMDLLWGSTGLMVAAVVWGVVFGVENKDIGFGIGWALPWVWAACMTIVTIRMSKNMLRKEEIACEVDSKQLMA